MEVHLPSLEWEEEEGVEAELLQPAGQQGGREDPGVLDLSHQLVRDLLTEELCVVELAVVLRPEPLSDSDMSSLWEEVSFTSRYTMT